MGAIPQHPFFREVLAALESYNKRWWLPYVTVMYSTGPLFLSVIWKDYISHRPSGPDRVYVLEQEYSGESVSYFAHYTGNSWHSRDAETFLWVSSRLHTVMAYSCQSSLLNVMTDGKAPPLSGSCWMCSYGSSRDIPMARLSPSSSVLA